MAPDSIKKVLTAGNENGKIKSILTWKSFSLKENTEGRGKVCGLCKGAFVLLEQAQIESVRYGGEISGIT